MQHLAARIRAFDFCRSGVFFAALLASLLIGSPIEAQFAVGLSLPMVTQPINESDLVVLSGNTRPEARVPANDQGLVADDMSLPHMMLQLRRPAAQEQALVALIDELHDRNLPNFHHWLTAAEIGERFGPAVSDIDAVTGWLSRHGFTVNTVYTNKMVIDFSGTAGQVGTAFHTEIHHLLVNGITHFANVSDPQIPAALAPAVVGIVSLHDFMPSAASLHHEIVPNVKAGATPTLTDGITQYISPGDIATIYNFRPMFSSKINGQGQTIYVVGNSQMYRADDWSDFRTAFGIPTTSYVNVSMSLEFPQPPSGQNNCVNPGVNNSDAEATLDVEYASAGAPGANIVLAVCSDSNGPTSGILIAVQNLVNGAQPPAIMSISYQHCEAVAGATMNAAINTAYQTGVAGGMSIYVAAGDQGGSLCTNEGADATTGFGVNAFAATQYNVAVGGTDFEDYYLGENSTYWNSSNAADWSSAKSYIPEIPWNSSCASRLIAQYNGYDFPYGVNGFCYSTFVTNNPVYKQAWAGGGGPSSCATGTSSTTGVANGTCAGYAKPSWQSLVGVPNDGVRDVPDVSLFASGGPTATGPWHRTYVWCFSDTSRGGKACTTSPSGWTFGGFGTSFATPIWAGIQALINQQTGQQRQGNPNARLYQIAAAEYGSAGSLHCASNNGPPSFQTDCTFYDVAFGDNDVPCFADAGTFYNCYTAGDPTLGVLSTSTTSYAPAYQAQTGWDFATGIGTVNVSNLVAIWSPRTGTHDFNGGGMSDILWRGPGGDVAVWLMSRATAASSVDLGPVPATWSIVGQRDFNGDGKTDLLWRDTSGNTAIWFMNGTAFSSAVSLGAVPLAWSVVGTGDFNGDGKGDILWRDSSGNVGVWLMNGATAIAQAGLGNVPNNWTLVGTGDFDGDKKSDLLWQDNLGNIAIWFMNGTTVGSTAGVGNITNWTVAGTGDFNGDGKSDIVWHDTAGDAAIWLMNGATISSAGGIGTIPTTWSVAQTGDYNGDGRSDLLWRDTSGNTAMWFMNGAAIASTAGVGNVPTSWTVQSVSAE